MLYELELVYIHSMLMSNGMTTYTSNNNVSNNEVDHIIQQKERMSVNKNLNVQSKPSDIYLDGTSAPANPVFSSNFIN